MEVELKDSIELVRRLGSQLTGLAAAKAWVAELKQQEINLKSDLEKRFKYIYFLNC